MFNDLLSELQDLNPTQSMFFKAIIIWIIYLLIRNIPSIITAIVMNREAKKHNCNRIFFTFLGYAFPIITPIGFFLFVKYKERRKSPYERHGISKGTVITFFVSVIIISVSFILAFSSTVLGAGSLIKSLVTGEHIAIYYDRMGNEYSEWDTTIDMYDRSGNKYVYKNDGLFKPTVYVDENGNEFDAEKCFIDSDGWLVYDSDGSFKLDESYDEYICPRFTDDNGNKYYQIGDFTFRFANDGEIYACWGKTSQKLDFTN